MQSSALFLCAVLAAILVAGSWGMECNTVLSCPSVIDKVGNAITGSDNQKTMCCRKGALELPYCCDALEYAKYAMGINSAESTKVVMGTTMGAILIARLL
ncbi:hypothetical protein RvY_12768 [Ramazzottius varieornatus]|uniref:Hydrophobin n=1 Tax=Ramazzottius varieornatus TaxID=947166 RepID=A0A1D1VML7_RAMVA|nr:hypothetical protein RvY_12768 [Ramazzottius varieornatus]